MDLGQNIRKLGAGFTGIFKAKPKSDPFATHEVPPAQQGAPIEPETKKKGSKKWLLLLLLLIVPLYYLVGALLTHRINDNLNFIVKDPGPGKSHTVAVVASLIDREVNKTKWSPNIQAFEPAALLRVGGNMVNFQTGLIKGLATTVYELENRLARVRGTSAADKDMSEAREGLARSADTWLWAGADGEYRRAMTALNHYNDRLAGGQANFEQRADNLQFLLDHVALDLGGMSDALDREIKSGRHKFIDFQADKTFYYAKGQAYAYFIVLRALREDYPQVISERHLDKIYEDMLTELASAAEIQPMIVQNAAPNAQILPNHLATEGFYILRARAKLREITDILQR